MSARRLGSIRRRGTNVWQLVAEGPPDPRTGRRRQRTRAFRGSEREAERALTRFLVEVSTEQIEISTVTVDQLWVEYIAVAGPDMAPGTADNFAWFYRVQAQPVLGRLAVAKVNSHHLERLYADLRDHGGRCRLGPKRKCPGVCEHGGGGPLSPATVKRLHIVLHAMFEQACRWHWITRNPCDDVARSRRISARRKKPAPASSTDVARLTAWLAEEDMELWVFVMLASRRGARPGEICALRWSDVDTAAGVISFARSIGRAPGRQPAWVEKSTKTGDERSVALVGGALAAVVAHRRACVERALQLGQGLPDDAFVFNHGDPSWPWQPGNISRRLRRARVAAGVGPVTFRALRHHVATTLIRRGVDPLEVAGTLGHARPSMTLDVYSDWVPATDQTSAAMMDDELDVSVDDVG